MVGQPRMPSLVSISAFEAAARNGSFAAAARELGTSAASVSYHVRRLEQAIDARLFRRFPHRVELTRAGRAISAETTAAFGALRATFAQGAAIDDQHLSITALPTFGTSWLTPRLGHLRDRHPQLRIELDLTPEARDLGSGQFDAAIRNGHGRWQGMKSILLFPSMFMPLCAPRLLDRAKDMIDGSADFPLLGRSDWWALWFRALGRDSPREFGIHLAEEHLDAAAAIAGHGVTIGSPILFRSELEAGRLIAAHDLVVSDGRSFWLTYPAARGGSRKIRRFETWIIGQAEEEREASSHHLQACVCA